MCNVNKGIDPEKTLMKRIERRFMKGIMEYGLIEDGDRILVGLSGGKDSLALTELLARRSQVWKPRFEVAAAYISITNMGYQSDVEWLAGFCKELKIPFYVRESSFDLSTDKRKSPCFLCSWNRRKALFTLAHELKCNKIALGHHMEDILQTLLMNLTFQGTFSTMPPKLLMRKFQMTLIRPLCLVHEDDLMELSALRKWPHQIKNCPYENLSGRTQIKSILKQLEQLNPEARYSMWGAMSNVQKELLPQKAEIESTKDILKSNTDDDRNQEPSVGTTK
ncbi:tRNA 2-thiocytidine(32) synthetase TtcA [Bacteroides sp. ET71]|nr:tRNA 2-thiocytidine(32) synthetase TtcA [Bacteroides sp. ET71]